jgi:hypothetical protein
MLIWVNYTCKHSAFSINQKMNVRWTTLQSNQAKLSLCALADKQKEQISQESDVQLS